MSSNPNLTAHYVNIPSDLSTSWKKYIIHGATPNDTKLDLTVEQKNLIPRGDLVSYDWTVYPKPNTPGVTYESDLVFLQTKSPSFDIRVEKIKMCLHQASTYGCVKVNVWDFGNDLSNDPINICNVNVGQPSEKNCPVSIIVGESLVSNALDSTDLYMVNTSQTCSISPFDYTISANSYIRMGIQYAEGNAYGLKVFIVGWSLECTVVEES